MFFENVVVGVFFQNFYSWMSCLMSIEDTPTYCLFPESYYLYELQK